MDVLRAIGPMIPDALALEYKRNYGCATVGKSNSRDLVNYPPLASEFRRLGSMSLPEETFRLVLGRCSVRSAMMFPS